MRQSAAKQRASVLFLAIAGLHFVSACAARSAQRTAIATIPPAVADTIRSERLAPGVSLHHLVRNTGPLRAHVLDIDLSACVSVRALKGAPTSVGRSTTSALLRQLPDSAAAIAAVNADFFLFSPPGVPVGALVVDGRLFAGPIDRAVVAFDRRNVPYIGRLNAAGSLTTSRGRVAITTWNRPTTRGVGVTDRLWGQPLDSLTRPTALQLVPILPLADDRYRVISLSPAHSGQAQGDTLTLTGARGEIREGDTVTLELTMQPEMPHTAVGGFPLLVRDSIVVATVDSAGAASFRGVNPRTAAGYANNGKRLFLVVIDGRQASYSVGTTTRETAELLRDLGAREAVNLDGGGSTAMVVRDAASGAIRVVNKPSDAAGERPVANALAVTGRCERSN